MDPFEAPGPSAGSRERLDRLRDRPVRPVAAAPRSVVPWLVSAVLLAFALGLIANPWFERRVRASLPAFAATAGVSADELAADRAAQSALAARVTALEHRPPPRAAAAGVPVAAPSSWRASTRGWAASNGPARRK